MLIIQLPEANKQRRTGLIHQLREHNLMMHIVVVGGCTAGFYTLKQQQQQQRLPLLLLLQQHTYMRHDPRKEIITTCSLCGQLIGGAASSSCACVCVRMKRVEWERVEQIQMKIQWEKRKRMRQSVDEKMGKRTQERGREDMIEDRQMCVSSFFHFNLLLHCCCSTSSCCCLFCVAQYIGIWYDDLLAIDVPSQCQDNHNNEDPHDDPHDDPPSSSYSWYTVLDHK